MTELDLSPADLAAYEAELATGQLAISAETQDLLFRGARTANAFTDEPVTQEQVRAIYDLVKWAPTAMNSQPLRVAIIRSREARERLVPHMSGNNAAKTLGAPLVAVLAADADFHDEFPKTFPVNPNARAIFAGNEVGRARAAAFSATLQAGYFILGVRAAGLAAGPMTGFDAEAVAREFFPDGRHHVLMVVNLGHPSEDAYRPRQPRLDYDEVVATF